MQNIITKNEFTNYINTNYFLTELQKKSILYYNNQRFKFFVDNNSNKQIITFYKEAHDNDNIEEITRLQLLLNHFMPNELSEKVIDYIKTNKKINDSDIINFILKNIAKLKQKNIITKENKFKCNKWVYGIQYVSLIYLNLIRLNKIKLDTKNIKYLDICCGSGKKTELFQKNLHLQKENTYCTDIETWGPYKNKNKIPFQFKLILDGKLDYDDNFFDLTTCILSLHHIKDLNNFTNKIGFRYSCHKSQRLLAGSSYHEYKKINKDPLIACDYIESIGVLDWFLTDNSKTTTYSVKREKQCLPTMNLKVISIKNIGLKDVYDIQVDKTHSFLANGIVAHNCMIAHGVSRFLKERLFEKSDPYTINICDTCGNIATSQIECRFCNEDKISRVNLCYASKLLCMELMAMNIKVKFSVKK